MIPDLVGHVVVRASDCTHVAASVAIAHHVGLLHLQQLQFTAVLDLVLHWKRSQSGGRQQPAA